MKSFALSSSLLACCCVFAVQVSTLQAQQPVPVPMPVRVPVMNMQMVQQFQMRQPATFVFTELSFDKLCFGNKTLMEVRKLGDEMVVASIELIDSEVDLTEQQRERLEVAGRIDLERYFADYDAIKRSMTFGKVPRIDWLANRRSGQDQVKALPRQIWEGWHRPSSLFSRTLTTSLQKDQYQKLERILQTRAKAIYVNEIRATLAIVERKVPLTEKQRSTIISILSTKTEAPSDLQMNNIRKYVLRQMGELEDELQKVFTEQEWKVVSEMTDTDKVRP